MKKFTLFLLAFVTFASTAVAQHQLTTNKVLQTSSIKKEVKTTANKHSVVKSINPSQLAGKHAISARKADGSTSIEGTWTFTLGDWYNGDNSQGSILYDFEASLDGTDVWFEDPTNYEFPFVATYNASTGVLTFEKTYLGNVQLQGGGSACLSQEPFIYDWDLEDLAFQDITAQYSGNLITFEPDNGIYWGAYSDQALTNKLGVFGIYDLEGAVKGESTPAGPIDEVQEGQWIPAGRATFVDAWVLPGYTISGTQINPNDYAYEVELQQNAANKNLYRLWKPYKSAGALVYEQGLNLSTYEGQIQIDVTDPDHVVVVPCGLPSGFKNSNGEFYMINELGWYVNYSGMDAATIVSVFGDELESDTLRDGVITINSPLFDFDPQYSEGYSWENSPYKVIITFIQETEVENINSNIQAARKVIENGQVVIILNNDKKVNVLGTQVK